MVGADISERGVGDGKTELELELQEESGVGGWKVGEGAGVATREVDVGKPTALFLRVVISSSNCLSLVITAFPVST